jgi:hypothetical protein
MHRSIGMLVDGSCGGVFVFPKAEFAEIKREKIM